jgi:hypothetical protein
MSQVAKRDVVQSSQKHWIAYASKWARNLIGSFWSEDLGGPWHELICTGADTRFM